MRTKTRIVSALLALSMTAGIMPTMPAFADEDAQLLKTERADMSDLPADAGYFTMGNAQTNLPEKDGRYILTIYRDGDVNKDASVKVKTVDVSAVYGKDYIMDDDRYETVTQETEGTIMERFGKDEYLDATQESIEEINENSEKLEQAYEAQQLAGSDEEGAAPAPEEAAQAEPQEKSALAQIKEAQTGLETRETYESKDSILNVQNIAGGFDVANQMETSSYTTVNFAAGETEKQVIFKILDDGESEGQEMINFILSEPVDAAVTEPFTTTIVVEDDEPVEHSKVSFTSSTYNAENGTATVTFKREGALYQYVTGEVKSKNGTAVSGTNFKAVNGTVEFLPYRDEATIEIPVTASAETTSFKLELSDLKGGDDGEIMSAEVFIDGAGANVDTASVELMADEKIKINNTEYRLDKSSNPNFARIYSEDRPNATVGYYVSPTQFGYKGAGGEDTPSYSTCQYDAGKGAGVLKWYSRLVWDKGYVKAEYAFDQRWYQSVWVDFATFSNSDASKHYFNVWYQRQDNSWNKSDNEVAVLGAKNREIRGAVKNNWTYYYENGGLQSEQRVRGDKVGVVNLIAERVKKELREPDMNVYGIILINKHYDIEINNADPLDFKTTNGGTTKIVPGKVSIPGYKDVYRGGTVVFNNDPISGQKQKLGELIGYDIECGAGLHTGTIKMRPARLRNELGNGYDYFNTNELSNDCLTVNFTDALVDCINGRAGATSDTGLGYDIKLKFKPVYRYIPVKMNIIPSEDGSFDSQYLKESSTNQLHFGDEIDLKATPNSSKPGMRSDSYAYKAYETAGSTLAAITSDETNYEENKTIQLCYRKYDLKPLFTDLPNHIQIDADREVLKYFDISGSVSGNTTDVDGLKGMTLLKTGTGQYGISPVAGKAYKIEIKPKSGVTLPSGVRPRITNEYNTSTYVDGYVMDIIAQAQYEQNRYKITLESYSGDYQYYDLKGVAQYSSIAMMDNTKPLTNEPAKMNQVYAGGWLQTAKDATSGDDITIPQRQGAVTDNNGKIDIAGVKAVPGDVISVLVTNNNIDQVRYLKLSDAGKTEDKKFSEITGYKETEDRFGDTVWESIVTEVTKQCTVVDMNKFEMPVKTAYAPYVRNVSLEYDTGTIAGNTNSVPLPDVRPLLTMKARVETNNTDVKFVEFIIYKSNGEPKGKIAAVTEDSNGKLNTAPQYTYRTEKPDDSGYCSVDMESKELDDGDELFVRIVSNTKNDAGEYITYPAVNVGVTFYTPIADGDGKYVEVDLESMGEIPYVKTLSGKMDSGKLYFDTEYADPKNKRTSAYTKTVGISADLLHLEGSSEDDKGKDDKDDKGEQDSSGGWFNQDAFNKATNGQHNKSKESNDKIIADQKSKMDPAGEAKKMKTDLLGAYDEEIAKRFPNRNPTDKEKEAVAKELYEKDAYKNSEGQVGSEYTVDMSAKVVLQFTYVYDEKTKQHVFGSGEYLIAATVGAEKIWTWVVSGVPLYIQVKGDISVQVDGTWINPDKMGGTTLTAKEMNDFDNMLENRFSHKTEAPWIQLGLNVKLTAGIGKCGVLDAHGSLKLGLIFRFTFVGEKLTTNVSEDEKGGTMVDFSGSIGVTLLVVTIDITLARIQQGWGKYDTDGPIFKAGEVEFSSVDEEAQERAEKGYTTNIRPTKVGNERDGDSGWNLFSVLKEDGRKNVKEDTMERIEPQAVQLNNGNTFVAYISGDESNGTANAATLKYMIRDRETGQYSPAKEVKADGVVDALPTLLYDSSKGEEGTVYVAWTSADEKLKDLTGDKTQDIQITKDNLKTLELYLASYDVKNDTFSEAKKLTDDKFVNSDAKLSIENGNIAVYYFKRNIDIVNKVEDLLSMTQNYNTWAKQLINPATMEAEVIGQYASDDNFGHKAGQDITEELLYAKHPTVTDPLVTDLSTATYTYQYTDDDPKTEYGFATYTIDRDGSLETTADHEVWLQIMNVTSNKTYYPILLDSANSGTGDSDVSMPSLTKQGDDVLISWIKDGSKFNMISVKDTLDAIRTDFRPEITENMTDEQIKAQIPSYDQSALKIYADQSATNRYWYRTAGNMAATDVGSPEGINAYIAEDNFPIVTKDFGTNGRTDALRKDSLIGDYHLITGEDGNIYLFWAESSDDPDVAASTIYASAFNRVSAASQEKYGTQAGYGFSDPVVISDPGLMIDELTAVVNGDLSALLLANTYERKFVDKGPQKDPFEDGPHNLTEFKFVPFNSLEVVDNAITMYNVKDVDNKKYNANAPAEEPKNDTATDYTTVAENYPKAGEKIMFSWSLKNTGLLPSAGHTVKLEVLDGSKELYKFEETKRGDGEQIYAGNALNYSTTKTQDGKVVPLTWTVPENLNLGNVTIKLTVNELSEDGEPLDDQVVVERKLKKDSSLQYQAPYVVSYSDMVDEFNNLTFENLPDVDFDVYDDINWDDISEEDLEAYLEKLGELLEQYYPEYVAILSDMIKTDDDLSYIDTYDYVVYVPVRNIGNNDSKVTAKLKYVDGNGELTEEILGETKGATTVKPITTDSGELSYIAIPVDVEKKHFDNHGVIKGLIDIYEGNDKAIENIGVQIFEDGNIDFTLASENETIKLEKGATHTIETEAYPFDDLKDMEYHSSDESVVTVSDDGVVTAVGAGSAEVIVTDNDSNVTRELIFEVTDSSSKSTRSSGGGGGSSSRVNVYNSGAASKNGKVSVSNSNPKTGDSVTVTVTPNEGYEVDKLIVTDSKGNEIEVTKNADGTFSYVQPDGKVTVKAEYKKTDSDDPGNNGNNGNNGNKGDKDWWFKDVPETAWYYAPIKDAYDAGRMAGMSEDYFEPETDITRGMFASAIYRREGSPETDAPNKFADVKEGSYYETAIAWATENGIVAGYDDTHYGPDDQITREQMAAILYRYAQFKNYDVSVGEDTNILDFTDALDISEYAIPAIQWAVGDNVITGFEDGSMRPKANANRAQMAVILNKISNLF